MKKEKLLELAVMISAVLIQHDTEGGRNPGLKMGRDRRAKIIEEEMGMLEGVALKVGIVIEEHTALKGSSLGPGEIGAEMRDPVKTPEPEKPKEQERPKVSEEKPKQGIEENPFKPQPRK